MRARALVLGAGISGIQASLDIANSGYEVVLVEQEPSIGGHMAQLSETFPTLDCSQCIMTPRTVEVGNHELIKLFPYSEIKNIKQAKNGNFTVEIRQKAAYVDWDKCTGCGVCQEKCPFKSESLFERGMGKRKNIYTLSPQAVPNKPVIDAENCRYLRDLREIKAGGERSKPRCGICAKVCPTEAIVWEQQDTIISEEVGAVILATGYDLFSPLRLPEYGSGRIPDVIDGLAFERLLASSGPTTGRVLRPSDGKPPQAVVFVQCSGSRDPQNGVPYCSKICCMYTAKQAILFKHQRADGQAFVFYIDTRTGGKGYEEFLMRAQEKSGVVYLRGKVSKLYREGGKVIVVGADTLSNRAVEIAADLVVLATAIIAKPQTKALADMLGIATDANGFLIPANEEFEPVLSLKQGVFLAGSALGPKDIPETVAQASGAAAKVLSLFRQTHPKHPAPQEPRHE